MREYEAFIDGKHVPAHGGATIVSSNPANGEHVSLVSRCARRDARRAIDAARRAADAGAWSTLPSAQRAERLHHVADLLWERQAEIADLDVAEAGVPIRIALQLVADAIESMRRIADRAAGAAVDRLAVPDGGSPIVRIREPHGVVAAIAPSDAPFLRAILATAPALAAGNTVVLEPARATPSSAMEIARAISESDLPPGAFNALPGAFPEVDDELASNGLVDRLVFAGTYEDGIRLAEAAVRSSKVASIELRTTCNALVLADADLDLAVPGVLWGALLLSGQTPRSANRLLVHASVVEPFVHHLKRGAAALRLGDPFSFATDIGPVLGERDVSATEKVIKRATEDGAQVVCGGTRMGGLGSDLFFAPTVVTGVTSGMRAAHEPLTGPLVTVIAVRDDDEAVAIANGGTAAPAAAVWTRDAGRGMTVARRLRAPSVWVNEYHPLATGLPGALTASGAGIDAAAIDDAARLKGIRVDQRSTVRGRTWIRLLGLDTIFGIDGS